MNTFHKFTKNEIYEFIEYGKKTFILEKNDEIDLFKEYSRCYMNFLMNHTNYIYILHLYKLLLLPISDYKHLIPNIIHINNYILSIIDNKTYEKLNIMNGYLNFENYFKAAIYIDTPNFNIIQINQLMKPEELITNLNILEIKYYHIKNLQMNPESTTIKYVDDNSSSMLNYNTIENNELFLYTKNELYDYIKFFYFIGNEIYRITKIDDIKIVLEELKTMSINKHYMEIILYIIKTFYNILNNKFKLDIYKSIMNFYNKKYISSNKKINVYLDKFIIEPIPPSNSFIYNTLVISSIICIMIIKYNYHI